MAVFRHSAGLECDIQQEPDALVAAGKNRTPAAYMASSQFKLEPVFCSHWIYHLYVAFKLLTDAWVNFKLFGFTSLMLVFVLAQGAWLSKYVDEKKENN